MEDGDDFAAIFNLCGGCFWLVIAVVIAWKLLKAPRVAKLFRLLPPAFAVFGISDLIGLLHIRRFLFLYP